MSSTFTTNKNIEKPGHNDYVDTWDVPVNADFDVIDSCFGQATINMTSLSSYTLLTSNVQSSALRFTGTLNSGSIPIKLTNGISGPFTIIDATTPTDSTSRLQLSWSSGGNSVLIPQGATQSAFADGTNLIWSRTAAPIVTSMPTITFSSSNSISLDAAQVTIPYFRVSGTLFGSGLNSVTFPSGTNGAYSVYVSASFGSAPALSFFVSGGSTGYAISSGGGYTFIVVSGVGVFAT